MSDVSEIDLEARSSRDLQPPRQFACLIFDDEDRAIAAEMIITSRRAVAMQRAMSLARVSEKAAGFQLWTDGKKVAEYFESRHAAASRMVSGPVPRSLLRNALTHRAN